jgi:hypothetical protein
MKAKEEPKHAEVEEDSFKSIGKKLGKAFHSVE